MTSKLPLRTALIGLSSTAVTSWASTAHLPALLSDTGRPKFVIKALLNSSVDAAKAAIEKYNIPPDAKAYGSPVDLAADPDIDLVICNTRVDKHFETIIDSVRKGKDVYVEWPVAAKAEHIEELIETSKQSGSRIAVGLQGRWAPPAVKLRELLENGRSSLGKVLSAEYFAQKEVGGNPIVIGFGHVFDTVLSVLGELDLESIHGRTQLQRPEIRIRNPSTNKIVGSMTSDVPDLLSFHGALVPSQLSAPDATLSFYFRRGQPFPGTPSLTWTINCERGEIRLVSPSGIALQASAYESPVTIQVHRFDTNEVEEVEWGWSERQEELPLLARSVSECLYAFADGKAEGDGWTGIESAAVRARLIEKFLSDA
ncbi:NAD(P)-binding protein [Ophiobolus disseminans]|uniref:NAD(P)-binding protein n=1 Tax=Ophiobolus disseminans TaxID=1469910 RepID=A0A6A7AH16_9PLEO|nr:NAD(P)-binding protein [Ophiobolus disseminans]